MGHNNNNMGAIWYNNINKGYNYNSNGVITSIIGTQQHLYPPRPLLPLNLPPSPYPSLAAYLSFGPK